MGLTSLQVCMDSNDWLQGTLHDESGLDGMDSSSSPSGDILTCSRPLIERRLRPQHDQALKCPRCDSTHTKFCYYNNYSLTQPRYFCKTCRRYWTKGGTLRNIPVGGGCRKNKKVAKKSTDQSVNQNPPSSSSHHNPTDLHLSIPEIQLSHLSNILTTQATFASPNNFVETKYNNIGMPIDFMESKLEGIVGSSRNYDSMANADHHHLGIINGLGDMNHTHHGIGPNFNDLCSPFGMSLDGNSTSGTFMETCQRLMLPFDHLHHHQGNDIHDHNNGLIDVKPNAKLLSLDWQEQGGSCPDNGYINNFGSWTGLMNGYGSSATAATTTSNTLV